MITKFCPKQQVSALVSVSFAAVMFGGGISTSFFLYAELILRDIIDDIIRNDGMKFSRRYLNNQLFLPPLDRRDACSFRPPMIEPCPVVIWLMWEDSDTCSGTFWLFELLLLFDLLTTLISLTFLFLSSTYCFLWSRSACFSL